MNNNSNKKKNRVPSSAGRPVRSRGGPDRLAVSPEGVYCNASFMQAITLHIGDKVTVYTVHGKQFEGYLKTFSKTFELVVSMTHQVDPDDPDYIDPSTVVDVKIFKLDDIVRIEAKNVDLEYAIRDTFATDTAISKFNGVTGERELEPWTEDNMMAGPGGDSDFDLDQMCNHSAGPATNGWDVNDMFKKNETVYGVQSTFDQSLSGYTVQIQKRDTAEFKEAEARAAAIANEIENNPAYRARVDLENGDEEDRFAAVTRPTDPGAAPPPTENGKYVPPAKRNHQPQQGKLMPRTITPSTSNTTSTSSGPPTPTQTSLPSPLSGTPTPPLSRQDSSTQSPPTPTLPQPTHPQQQSHSHPPQSDRQSNSHSHTQESRHHHDRHSHHHSHHSHSNSTDRQHHTHSNHSSLERDHQHHHRQQEQRQQHGDRQERQERHNVERQDSRHSDRQENRHNSHSSDNRQHNDNRQQQQQQQKSFKYFLKYQIV
uniref:Ataxin-2 n=1 Tax=Cacopsylla melanoneura TaxID=428564 RepID=A0A8D9BW42_9HEMI